MAFEVRIDDRERLVEQRRSHAGTNQAASKRYLLFDIGSESFGSAGERTG
jgi:hypothetical protein